MTTASTSGMSSILQGASVMLITSETMTIWIARRVANYWCNGQVQGLELESIYVKRQGRRESWDLSLLQEGQEALRGSMRDLEQLAHRTRTSTE
jgi:hypothetical protein